MTGLPGPPVRDDEPLHPAGIARRSTGVSQRSLTLLYDGHCPFCRAEVEWLLRRDRGSVLAVEDIAAEGFDASRYGLDPAAVNRRLHGITAAGEVVEGMAAVRAAYRAVGLGFLMAPTGWPVLRWVFDLAYFVFARYRVPLGRLFGRRSCAQDRCGT